ncbi:MAG: hypothetical protein ABIR71_04745 [Chthoniobacterales bacterium]
MKKYLCILASAALFTACEQKTETVTPAAPADATHHDTTVVNPPAAVAPKTETNTTIVNPTPAETKTETNTTINQAPAATPNP